HDDYYRWVGHHFDHEKFFAPLAAGRDELKGLHANTHIPQVIGAARRYELTGEARYRDIAEYFWREVTTRRAYCTGGTSNGEGWQADPGILSTELSGYTQEDCTTYNMLKLTRHVFGWTGDPACADFYERALWNGILGSQHPADGEKMYYVSLAPGLWKLFGTPGQDYWCCTGTMSEAFSKLGDSIYFQDDAGLYVNLFIASELDWQERGVRLTQETRFPESDSITLTVRAAKPAAFALRLRVPWWATGNNTATLNGRPLEGFAAPGGYYVLNRTWRDGDKLSARFPMSLHLDPTPDDPSLQAAMYGPLVLAGRLGTAGLTPQTLRAEPTQPRHIPEYKADPVPVPAFAAPSDDPGSWIAAGAKPLTFHTTGQAQNVEFVPFHQIFDERYAIYWKVTRA
ncbi:MAG TPA: beta-L-arabinofuranosidase domain-containing protein, partial [Gemmatimonadales bacterium]|nr:beta-L-arabinofuranosidase domain-containing protein [Gemmatimonadales bacterium]